MYPIFFSADHYIESGIRYIWRLHENGSLSELEADRCTRRVRRLQRLGDTSAAVSSLEEIGFFEFDAHLSV